MDLDPFGKGPKGDPKGKSYGEVGGGKGQHSDGKSKGAGREFGGKAGDGKTGFAKDNRGKGFAKDNSGKNGKGPLSQKGQYQSTGGWNNSSSSGYRGNAPNGSSSAYWNNSVRFNGYCNSCGDWGHKAANCRKRPNRQANELHIDISNTIFDEIDGEPEPQSSGSFR